jgi:hypothetical protein
LEVKTGRAVEVSRNDVNQLLGQIEVESGRAVRTRIFDCLLTPATSSKLDAAEAATRAITFPHAAQALQVRRRRRRLDQPGRFTTETIYAITDLHTHQARPHELAGWIRGHWSIEHKTPWVRDVTFDEDRSEILTATGPQVMAALRNSAIGALRTADIINIAVHAVRTEEDGGAPLIGHDPVVGVPVVMCTAGGGEDCPQQQA